MAVTVIDAIAKKNFQGLSTDTKPTSGVPEGATFWELDTNTEYVFSAKINPSTSNGWWPKSTNAVATAGSIIEAVTLQNAATSPGNGTAYTPTKDNMMLTFSIRGTSTSRTIVFEKAGPDGVYQSCEAINEYHPAQGFASQTVNGSDAAPETWTVSVPVGWSFRARIAAVSGGNVTISGWGGVMQGVDQRAQGMAASALGRISLTEIDASYSKDGRIFGASWDKGSSPTLTRTDSAVGLTAAAGVDSGVVTNDFDFLPIFGEIHDVTDAFGNVFVRIPKFYIRKTDGVGVKTWQVSKTKYKGFYLPWCFWDFTNSRELPYVDIGKYKATKDGSNKLQSIANVYPLVNDTIVNFRTYAKNNGPGYQLLDIHIVDVLRTLMFIEFGTLNIQSIMAGYTAGQYTTTHLATVAETGTNRIIVANATADLYAIGQAISVGTSQGGNQIFYGRTITSIDVYDASNKAISFDGAPVNIAVGNMLYNTGWRNGFSSAIAASSGSIASNSDGKHPCAYRGIESPFGDIWQFVDGVNINNYQAWVAKNPADYTSNVFASPYEQMGYVNADSNGCVQQTGFDVDRQFAEFPTVSTGGSSSTYYSDYYCRNTGQRIALFGASWIGGAGAGVSYWSLSNASSAANVDVGGRLVKKRL